MLPDALDVKSRCGVKAQQAPSLTEALGTFVSCPRTTMGPLLEGLAGNTVGVQ